MSRLPKTISHALLLALLTSANLRPAFAVKYGILTSHSPAGREIVTVRYSPETNQATTVYRSGQVICWNLETMKRSWERELVGTWVADAPNSNSTLSVTCACRARVESLLGIACKATSINPPSYIAESRSFVSLVRSDTGAVIRVLDNVDGNVIGMALSDDGKRLALVTRTRPESVPSAGLGSISLIIIDVTSGRTLNTVSLAFRSARVALSSKGAFAAVFGLDVGEPNAAVVQVREAASGRVLQSLAFQSITVPVGVFAPDEASIWLAYSTPKGLQLGGWVLNEKGPRVNEFLSRDCDVAVMDISADGHVLAIAGGKREFDVAEASGALEVKDVRGRIFILQCATGLITRRIGSRSFVADAQLSSDGSRLLTGSLDGTLEAARTSKK